MEAYARHRAILKLDHEPVNLRNNPLLEGRSCCRCTQCVYRCHPMTQEWEDQICCPVRYPGTFPFGEGDRTFYSKIIIRIGEEEIDDLFDYLSLTGNPYSHVVC